MTFDEAMESLRDGRLVRRASRPAIVFGYAVPRISAEAHADGTSVELMYQLPQGWMPMGRYANPALYGITAMDWEIVEVQA
jgi:hypothetical protein